MIACDLDNVLATNRGMDTSHGEPIHRTFRSLPPQLGVIREAGLPFHVVTAKVSRQAWQILRAVGLADQVTSVVGAEVLFWPTIWSALRRGRLPSYRRPVRAPS
jgi:phosphoglycolate phosphatase-like HAD superfamily hydrolase